MSGEATFEAAAYRISVVGFLAIAVLGIVLIAEALKPGAAW